MGGELRFRDFSVTVLLRQLMQPKHEHDAVSAMTEATSNPRDFSMQPRIQAWLLVVELTNATNTLVSYYTMLVHKDFSINLWPYSVFRSLVHHAKDHPCIPDLGLRLPPYSYSKSLTPERAAVGTNFYIFSIDAVWGLEPDTSPTDRRTLNQWAISVG